jgi:hypothetical protein
MRAANDDADPEPRSPPGVHEFDDGAGIEAQMHRLCRFNSLISARRAGDLHAHATAVLLMQTMLRRAVIDALPPELSVPGTVLQFRTRFDGAELMFCSTVTGRVLHDGAAALAIALPSSIRVFDGRVARRLPASPAPLDRLYAARRARHGA